MNRREIKISYSLHEALKSYCHKQGLKIHSYAEKAIIEQLKKDGSDIPVNTFEKIN